MDKKKKDYEYGTLEYAEGIGKEYADMNYDSFKQGEEYSGLKKGYEQSGQKAMKDTIGQMAAKTGGLASSYAQTAGQQAYGDWMSRLEDAAYSMYGAQKQDKYNEYTLAQDAYKNRKAVADEEELKAKELKTQNENKLWMKFALGQLTPETMTDEDYATYGLSYDDAVAVYDDWLYQSADKRKADEDAKVAEGTQNFMTDLQYGLVSLGSNGVTEEIAQNYGIDLATAKRVAKIVEVNKEAANEESIYQLTPTELQDVFNTLFDSDYTANYKAEYLNQLKQQGYLTDAMATALEELYKSEIG